MDPINYSIDVKSPFESAVQGYQVGLALNQAQAQQRQQQMQLQAQQQMQADLADLSSNPNATAKDYAGIMVKYPQLSEHFKRSWDVLNEDQKQQSLSQASQVYSALQSGNPDVAKKLLDDRIQALDNSGMEKEANAARAMSQLIDMNPDSAKTSAALMLSSALGPERFASAFSTLSKLPGEVAKGEAEAQIKGAEAGVAPQKMAGELAKTDAETRNINSQINDRSSRLNLDRDKLQSDVEMKLYEMNRKMNPALNLGTDAKKIINDSTVSSVASSQSSEQMRNLANNLEKEGGGYGVASTAGEWLKKTMGSQNAMTQLRQEYTRIRSQQVSKMLPPGAASDRDVSLAMQGFPPETADAATLSSFLRGMSKLSDYSAATDNAKAEWVNSVGHLGKPSQDIVVDGVAVPAGTSFTDFAKQYIDRKVNQTGVQAGQQNVRNRSYAKYATGAR